MRLSDVTPDHWRADPGHSTSTGTGARRSIRTRLEADARKRYPALAKRFQRKSLRYKTRRRRLRWQDRTLLIIGITLMLMLLLRIETSRADATDWGMELNSANGSSLHVALDTAISAEISGTLARVSVTQQFRNNSPNWVEGVYRFPLPDGAAVDRMHIEVGNRILEGEIHEKTQARRIYQHAATSGRTASLVEQQRRNQFETRLANIGPGEEIHVTISFLQNVGFLNGEYSLRLPMTFTPRWEPPASHSDLSARKAPHRAAASPMLVAASDSSAHHLELEIRLLSSIGLASIESRYHDVEIQPEASGYRTRLLDTTSRTDRDFDLAWAPDLQSVPQTTVMTWDGGDAIYTQVMLTPPLAADVTPQAREVVFVIDTSGSMNGDSLHQAREALLRGLQLLGPDDNFNIVQFNSVAEMLFPASEPVGRKSIQQAADYLHGLSADGGTNMAPALRLALEQPVLPGLLRQVVFITDGSVGNESELLLYIGEWLDNSRLFTVSIGSAPNSWFMRKAAEIGRGVHTHIGDTGEVENRIYALWNHIRLPALSDICIDWGAGAEFYPEVIPDLYAGEPLWLTAKLDFPPSHIELCGTLDGRPWQTDVRFQTANGSENLATLWARRKIAALEDQLMFGAEPDEIREKITRVALDYGLLTRYTAMVAVDRTPVRPENEDLGRADIPGLLPAGSSISTAYANTATGWKTQLFLSLLTFLTAAGLLWSSGARLPMTRSSATS
jgi:Ca-activated chloride channel family protein